jgi:5-methylthioadenosine/S-adenosylhomocysteine deaminase
LDPILLEFPVLAASAPFGGLVRKPYSFGLDGGWVKEPVSSLLKGGNIVSPGDELSEADLCLADGRLVEKCPEGHVEIDVSGLLVFPSPINAHDHLLGSWAPKVGEGPYGNVYEWLDLLHSPDHPRRRERDDNPGDDVYMLGTYKNLCGGSASVVDHYVRRDDSFWEQYPIRIFHRFGRTWTLREETGWGGTIEEELEEAGDDLPYIIHVSEGVDEGVTDELKRLAERGGVRSNSLLVHGVAFDDSDMDTVAESGASVVWCPSSNMFLYERTLNVPAALAKGINLCLGTDSALSGTSNILEEARYAADVHRKLFGSSLDGNVLFEMLTSRAADALLVGSELGRLRPGYLADVLVAAPKCDDPVMSFLEIRPADVDLLLVGGRPAFGSARHADFFESQCETHSPVSVDGKEMLLVGDVRELLAGVEKTLGFKKELPFLPFDE